jgi:hypothetical protein
LWGAPLTSLFNSATAWFRENLQGKICKEKRMRTIPAILPPEAALGGRLGHYKQGCGAATPTFFPVAVVQMAWLAGIL